MCSSDLSRPAGRSKASTFQWPGRSRGEPDRIRAGGSDRLSVLAAREEAPSRHDRRRRIGNRELQAAAGHDAERHASGGIEVALDRVRDRRPGDGLITREIAIEVPGIADKYIVRVQLIRFSAETADGLQA